MIEIGYNNKMKVLRLSQNGAYLNGEDLGEILLPNKYVPENLQVDDNIDVFVYNDSEDRLVATTQTPYAHVNQFAWLECVQTTKVGAFLDWGLDKDLLLPFSEQKDKPSVGRKCFVYIYLDENTNRIVASQRLLRFMSDREPDYYEGERVEIFIHQRTELGYRVIVDNSHWGMIYNREMFRDVSSGQYTYGFVRKIRDDNRIDIMLEKSSAKVVDNTQDILYNKIKENGGFLPLTDKSSPEEIMRIFGISKKIFKKAVGHLYHERLIEITETGLKLVNKK
ncbi:MAG: S1-like domain-containing RNA-binding protein [Bacteroidales bacterium]|nr:S1-like domain-containing RNA-binding protein [Bacteroidales bacterium]